MKIDPVTGKFVRVLSDAERLEHKRASAKRYRQKLSSARHLSANHGLPLAEAEALLAGRPQACEICNEVKRLNYDHDHETGKFRGWLCHYCNLSLKMVEDPDRLASALRYLERANASC